MRLYQQLNARNKVNGNPRRLTIEYNPENGKIISVMDQGFYGDLIPAGSIELPTINIMPSEYQHIIRQAKKTKTFLES